MPLTKVTPNNLHSTVQTMVTTMVNENAVDSADVTLIVNSNIAGKSTSNLSEGTNLYYTNARADARVNLQTGANLVLSNKSTSDLSEGSNLYYTNARADARIAAATTSDLSEGNNKYYTTSRGDSDTGDYIAGNRTYGNITTTGYLRGPASFTIDPATHGDNTGTLIVAGNLQVDGTTTTINSTTVAIDDLNFSIATDAASSAAANGAGITVGGAGATLVYTHATTSWDMNKPLNVTGNIVSSGNVGIGTASPLGQLMVRDDTSGSATKIIISNNGTVQSGTSARLSFYEGTTEKSYIERRRDGSGETAFVTPADDNPFVFESSGSLGEFARFDEGKLGIGTDSPGATLHLDTASSGMPKIRFTHTNAGGDNFEIGTGVDGVSNGGWSIRDIGASANRFVIDSSGNVGIGTASPASKLHVKKDDSTAFSASSSTWHNIVVSNENTTGGTRTAGISFELNGYHANAGTGIAAVKNGTAGDYGAHLAFITRPQSAVAEERLRITDTGNVGIGTASPAALLHINGSGDAVRVTSTNTGSGGAQVDLLQYTTSPADNDIHGMINFGGYTSGTSAAYGSSIRSVWSDVSAKEGQLEFFTRDDAEFAARMTINKDGNVGIGTSTPARPLHVLGANAFIRIESTSTSQNSQLDIKSTAATWSIGQNQVLANTGTLEFYNGSSSPVVIKTNGNVGIGTTTPARPLNIVNDAGSNPIQSIRNSNTSWSQYALTRYGTEGEDFRYMDFGYYRGASEATRGLVVKSQANATLVTFLDSGNVGIGTVYPATPLQIYQSTNATAGDQKPTPVLTLSAHTNSDNEGPAIEFNSAWVNSGSYLASTISNGWGVAKIAGVYDDDQGNGGALSFYTNEGPSATSGATSTQLTEKMRIKPNGNVGIGTTGPGAKLSVSGPAALANLGGGSTGSSALYVNSTSGHIGELIQILKNGATKMHMANDGKLGIGTSSPDSLLHLQKTRGTITGGSSDTGAVLKLHTEAQWESGYGNNPSSANNDYLGSIEFSTGDSSTGEGVRAAIRGTVDSYYNQNSIVFETATGATAVAPIERMRILHNGNVGIGVASPNAGLEIQGPHIGQDGVDDDYFKALKLSLPDQTEWGSQVQFSVGRWVNSGNHARSSLVIALGHGAQNSDSNADTRVMTLTSNGRVVFSPTGAQDGQGVTTYANGANGHYVSVTGTSNYWITNHGVASSTGVLSTFYNNGTYCGGITISNTNQTSYVSASDYRLKENVVPMTGATERLKQLNPVTFDWINSGESSEGFIAHEVGAIVPISTIGTKDEVYDQAGSDDNPNIDVGDPKYQSVDPAKLVPLLVATIKELEARLTAAGI